MSLARTLGIGLTGLNGQLIEVEADVGNGIPAFILLGLPDAALNESRERIRSAARNSGIPLPNRRLTVNLTPATLHKRGSGFDLAILLAALAADRSITPAPGVVYLAELGLDGSLRPVSGVLPAVMAAVRDGYPNVVVATENQAEAELVAGASVRSYAHLSQVLAECGADPLDLQYRARHDSPARKSAGWSATRTPAMDLSEVVGQAQGRYALEVAAAGGHHLLFTGPPGAGKTMLAQRLPGLLPDLDDAQALETTAVHSLSAGGRPIDSLLRRPPFESPHHSASMVALIGGGSGIPRPGAASRAHRGVLFLDEAPEFSSTALDALRQPLESGVLTLHRASGTASYPARFQLLLAANPCPCGRNLGKGTDCTCTPMQRRRYLARLSGPLLDRIDMQLFVPQLSARELAGRGTCESSAVVAARVREARTAARDRLKRWGICTNAEVPGSILRNELRLLSATLAGLNRATESLRLSARGYDRVLRIAWSIADLNSHACPTADDVDVAIQLRQHGKGDVG
ncbi:YifB family Mg chelatase-like AAA ATPase [Paeniglutamicibacter sp. MACA_103]|uniref:YifB family Mg chelatase-like AAA ATPase n=1 Tax=Paeniglutamicibacter sp. MACA_103 TaxID=3377337 RepID=UPI003893A615